MWSIVSTQFSNVLIRFISVINHVKYNNVDQCFQILWNNINLVMWQCSNALSGYILFWGLGDWEDIFHALPTLLYCDAEDYYHLCSWSMAHTASNICCSHIYHVFLNLWIVLILPFLYIYLCHKKHSHWAEKTCMYIRPLIMYLPSNI